MELQNMNCQRVPTQNLNKIHGVGGGERLWAELQMRTAARV